MIGSCDGESAHWPYVCFEYGQHVCGRHCRDVSSGRVRLLSCWRSIVLPYRGRLWAGRTVSVKPVPYAPGPSSPRRVARGAVSGCRLP